MPSNAAGLSPRVRGNRRQAGMDHQRGRSIPARAGEPWPSPFRRGCLGVYPRACGGTASGSSTRPCISGLSPRVRGNHQRHHQPVPSGGSIPARAGEPGAWAAPAGAPTVYPRACGGTPIERVVNYLREGLSPRVRGNLHRRGWGTEAVGSIPARAGEPVDVGHQISAQRVYPRACGGTSERATGWSATRGLSPRVRGNHYEEPDKIAGPRSIPARAGEPARADISVIFHWVYPRACGGTRPSHNIPIGTERSIPARAGEPAGRSPS